jgi:hypothetical protein
VERPQPGTRPKFFPRKKPEPPRQDDLPGGSGLPETAYEQQYSGAKWERMWLQSGRPVPTPGPKKPQTQRMRPAKRAADDHGWQARPLDQPGGRTAAEADAELSYRQRQIRRGAREAERRRAAANEVERKRQRAKARARRRGAPVPAWATKQGKRQTIRSGGAGS